MNHYTLSIEIVNEGFSKCWNNEPLYKGTEFFFPTVQLHAVEL
jgi:hypothetical protein